MQNINFHGVYLPLLWGSLFHHKPPLCLGYSMGHFTALVPSGSCQQQLVVPLTDNTGHILPIRFLLQAEEQNTFYLLERYLDIIQKYSSSLGKEVPVAIIALKEATHMQHLVQASIDMSLTLFNEQSQPYYAQSQPPAPSQWETPRNPCVGCNTGAYGLVETNFLCYVCYKKQTSVAVTTGFYASQELKCCSPGCQQQGLLSKHGYCNGCYAKALNSGGEHQRNGPDTECRVCKVFYSEMQFGGLCSLCFNTKDKDVKHPRVLCKYPGCSFYADPKLDNYCQDCFDNKSGLANYKRCQNPTCSIHVPTTNASKFCDCCLMSTANKSDGMPLARVLCKYPGCSFYADPKLDNYCQDCFDNKSRLANYKRCQNPTCSKHVPTTNSSKFCDSCLMSTANKSDGMPLARVLCKYPGCSFYADPKLDNYCQDCFDNKSRLANYKRCQNPTCSKHVPTTNSSKFCDSCLMSTANKSDGMPLARVLCKYPGCSFYADPKLDNYCQDCFDNKSRLANYKRCQNPTCSKHVPTTNSSKFCDSCLMSTANKSDGMPLARVLCKYPGCSFYADPKLDNYCQDCFDYKSGLKNYKRCQNPTCSNHIPTTHASKFCDSCLMSTANKPDGTPRARVLCKYPGCSFYADPKLDNYCQDCFDNKSRLANYKRCQNYPCSKHVPTTNASKFCDSCLMSTANKSDGMTLARVLCKYPGCSFYADPKLDNYCQDCFDNKSRLANYKRCQNPTCSKHVPTTNASKFCDSCLMSTANKSDGMPLARVLCKYPGCSFYADPKLDNYCQDCFDNKSGLKNYKRCQNPTCSNHIPTIHASKFCDSCLMSTANKPDGTPRARVLCKYPGCSFYADPKLDNYCQDCFDNKSRLANYKRCQNPTCSKHVPTTNASKFCDSCLMSTANKSDGMTLARVLCKYPGCSFYADPKLDNYCQDCFDNKSRLANYKRCQNPTCSKHVPTTNSSKFCDSCLMSTANKSDGMPLARVLCKYPGCSFYADPKLDNYCQDCFDNKSGLKNYKRCQNPTCSNHIPTTHASKFCDSCLMSTANKPDGMPHARVLCKYPGCSFYADPKLDNYCQDCFDNKSGLKNYKRCQNYPCSNLVPTTNASIFCDFCLLSSAHEYDMPRVKVLCKYPGCSFFADPKLDNYCQDCFDKYGLIN